MVNVRVSGLVEASTGQQGWRQLHIGHEGTYPSVESGSLRFVGTESNPYVIGLSGVSKAKLVAIHVLSGAAVRLKLTNAQQINQTVPVSDWFVLSVSKPGDEVLYVGLIGSGDVEYLVAGEAGTVGGQDANQPGQVDALYSCDASVQILDAVYVSASDLVSRAVATQPLNLPIGLVASKPTPTSCYVRPLGELAGFSGLTPGAIYWLSSTVPGGMTTTVPNQAGEVAIRVGIARNATTLMVEVDDDPILL